MGNPVDDFVNPIAQDASVNEAKANVSNFGLKFKNTFGTEFQGQLDEAASRAQRLDTKPAVVGGIPNSFIYFALLVGGVYVVSHLIFKD